MSDLIYQSEDQTTKVYKIEVFSDAQTIEEILALERSLPGYELMARRFTAGEIAYWEEFGRRFIYAMFALIGVPPGLIKLP